MKEFLLIYVMCISCYKNFSYNRKHTVEISATDFRDLDKKEESTYKFPFLNFQWNERNNLQNVMRKNDCRGRNLNLPCNQSKVPTVTKHDKVTSNEIRNLSTIAKQLKKELTYKRDSTLYLETKELETVEDVLPNLSWYKKKKSTRTGVSTLGSKVASLLNKIYKQKKISTKKRKIGFKSSYPLYKPITPTKILLVPLLPKHIVSSSRNSKLPRMTKSLKNKKKVSARENFKASIMQALLSVTSRNAQAKIKLQTTKDPSFYNSVTHVPQMKKKSKEKNINKTKQKRITFSVKEKPILSSTASVIRKTEIETFSNTSRFDMQNKTKNSSPLSINTTMNSSFTFNDSIINLPVLSNFFYKEKQMPSWNSSAVLKPFSNASIFEKQEKIMNFANDTSSTTMVIAINYSEPDIASKLNDSILQSTGQSNFFYKGKQILYSTTSEVLKDDIESISNASIFEKQEKIKYIRNDSLSLAIADATAFSEPFMTLGWNHSIFNPREQSNFANKEKQILNSTLNLVQKINTEPFSNTSMLQKQERINNFVNDTSLTDFFIITNFSKPKITSMLNNSILNPIEQSNYSKQEKQILNLTTSATPKINGDSFWNTIIFEKLEKINNLANHTSSSAFVTPMIISTPDSISMLIGSDLKMKPTNTDTSKPTTPNPKKILWNVTKKLIKHITDDESYEEYHYVQTRKNVKLTVISKLFSINI